MLRPERLRCNIGGTEVLKPYLGRVKLGVDECHQAWTVSTAVLSPATCCAIVCWTRLIPCFHALVSGVTVVFCVSTASSPPTCAGAQIFGTHREHDAWP